MTLERTIARTVQDGRCDLDASRQSMERDSAPHIAPCFYHSVLEPPLVWLVGSHPGCYCSPVDMVNPRIFPATHSLDHWMSKGAMGERVWLNRDAVPVPVYHRRVPNVLSAISAISVLFIIWGVLMFDLWPTLFGTMLAYLSKLWFVDRMVWIWQDMQDATPEYKAGKFTRLSNIVSHLLLLYHFGPILLLVNPVFHNQ